LISPSCNILCLIADQKINQKGQETMTALLIFGFERSRAVMSISQRVSQSLCAEQARLSVSITN